MRVNIPDKNTYIDFPDGTSPEEIQSVLEGSWNTIGASQSSVTPTPIPQPDQLPPETIGWGVELGRAAVRSGTNVSEMLGNVMRTIGITEPGKIITHEARQVQKEYAPGKQYQESFLGRGLIGGVESSGPSLAAGLPGAIIGQAAIPIPVLGGLIGYAVGAFGMFTANEYQNYLDEYRKTFGVEPGDETKARAALSGLIEGGFEGISDLIGGGFLLKGAKRAGVLTIKELLRTPLKQATIKFAETAAVETGTEMTQNALEAYLRQIEGLPTDSPARAAVESIIPALTMTGLFNLGHAGIKRMKAASIEKTLTDPTTNPVDRMRAAEYIDNIIKEDLPKEQSQAISDAWKQYVVPKILTDQFDEQGRVVEPSPTWKPQPIDMNFMLDPLGAQADAMAADLSQKLYGDEGIINPMQENEPVKATEIVDKTLEEQDRINKIVAEIYQPKIRTMEDVRAKLEEEKVPQIAEVTPVTQEQGEMDITPQPKAVEETPVIPDFFEQIKTINESAPPSILTNFEKSIVDLGQETVIIPKGKRIALENSLFSEVQKPQGKLGGAVSQIGEGKVGKSIFSIEKPYGNLLYNEATGELKVIRSPLIEKRDVDLKPSTTLLLQTVSKDIVNNDLAGTIANETIQNALDALPAEGKGKREIGVKISSGWEEDISVTRVTVRDTGSGMTEREVMKYLLGLGTKGKEGETSRGGYGMAKAAFLLTPIRTVVTTVKNGIKTILTGTRQQFFKVKGVGKAQLNTEVVSEHEQNGTTFEMVFYADAEEAKKHNAFALDNYNAREAFKKYIGKGIKIPNIDIYYQEGEYDNPHYTQTQAPETMEQIYKKVPIDILGSKLTVYFVPDDKPASYPAWDEKYHVNTETFNKGLALFSVSNPYSTEGLWDKPKWKVIVDFERTPDVRSVDYPFIRNRTELNREVAKKVEEAINAKIKIINEKEFATQIEDFAKMVKDSPEVNNVKVMIPFKDTTEFEQAKKIVEENTEMVGDLANLFTSFQAVVDKIGGKKIELVMTVDPKIHGFRSKPEVTGHEFYAINPFAVTGQLEMSPEYKSMVGEGYDPISMMASNLVHTFIHEYTHNQVSKHNENYTSQLANNYVKMTHGQLARLEQEAGEFYGKHESKLRELQQNFSNMGKGGSRFQQDYLTVQPTELVTGRETGERGVTENRTAEADRKEVKPTLLSNIIPSKPVLSDFEKTQMAFDPKSFDFSKEGFRAVIDNLYTKHVYERSPVIEFIRQHADEQAAEVAMQRFRKAARVKSTADEILKGKGVAQYGFDDKREAEFIKDSKSLTEILKPIANTQMFLDYGTWRSTRILDALERLRPDYIMPEGLAEESRTEMARIEEQYADKIGLFKRIDAEQRQWEIQALLQPRVDSGLMSQETFDKITSAPEAEYYSSLQREMEEGESQFGKGKDPLKRRTGTEERLKILHPVESDIANLVKTIKIVEQQKSNRQIVSLRDQFEDLKEIIQEKKPKWMKGEHVVTKKELAEIAKKLGVSEEEISDVDKTTLKVYLRNPIPPAGTITVSEDGAKHYYTLPDDVRKALELYSSKEISTIVKVLSWPAKWLRAGATTTFDFILRNPVRDQFSAMVYAKYGYTPFWDFAKGLMNIYGKSDLYHEFRAMGGGENFTFSMDRVGINTEARDLLSYRGAKGLKILNPLEALRTVSGIAELGTRMGVYARARKAGATPQEAISETAEATTDFLRVGAEGRAISMITAFWNPNVQSMDLMRRKVFNKANAGRNLLRIGLGITLPSIILWAINHDDERYKELPGWQKDLFWIINIGKDKPLIRIPKPFELGILFGSLPERLLSFAFDRDPRGMKEVVKSIWEGAIPGIIPTAAVPVIENWVNYSFFTDRKLENATQEGLPPGMRVGAYTTGLAEQVGKMANISPIKIDNMIQGWTGGLGKETASLISYIMKNETPEVEKKWYEQAPGLKGFLAREPIGSISESVNNFYDIYEKTQQAEKGYKLLAKSGDSLGASKYYKGHKKDIAMAKSARAVSEQLSVLRKQILIIQDNKTMGSGSKRIKIDMLKKRMTDITRNYDVIYGQRK